MTSSSGESLQVRPVESRQERETFIRLPDRLYAGHAGYILPLLMERRETLDPGKNPYFAHARVRYWLAWRGERPVGRISAQVDSLHDETHGGRVGHFGFLDAEDDAAVFQALLDTAQAWLAAQGRDLISGPFSLSINQECGLMVEGFDAPSSMLMAYHPPYADRHVRAAGFEKARDLYCYDYDGTGRDFITERHLKRARLAERLRVRELDRRRYDEELRALLLLFNEAWADNWGFVPFTEAEMTAVGKQMKPVLDPKLVMVAELDGETISMLVALPNVNEAIADLDGRLLPFGWLKLLWRLKVRGVKSSRILLFGLRPEYQETVTGSLATLHMFDRLRRNHLARGYERTEISWVLEDNTMMRRLAESIEARHYKTYRIYSKDIPGGSGA